MADEAANRGAFLIQEHYCTVMDAPITARVCAGLARALSRESRTGALVLDWSGEPTADALPLRLVGGFHALHRAGADEALSQVFAGEETDADAVAAILGRTLVAHDAALLPWLDTPPQTNEPGRSAALMTGLIEVVRRFGQPLEVLEIGSSGGLNLLIDRYRFDLGGTMFGPREAPVTIAPDWRGAAPEPVDVAFRSVRGVDVRPIDVADPANARRLAAYVWVDQPERQERLAGAIAMVAAGGVDLVQGDAADWVEARLAEPQEAGVTRVLMHSVVWQYLGQERQRRIRDAMRAAGEAATEERPLAWVRMEPNRSTAAQEVWVRTWPDGGPARRIAFSHAHGTWVQPTGDAMAEDFVEDGGAGYWDRATLRLRS